MNSTFRVAKYQQSWSARISAMGELVEAATRCFSIVFENLVAVARDLRIRRRAESWRLAVAELVVLIWRDVWQKDGYGVSLQTVEVVVTAASVVVVVVRRRREEKRRR
ncbi:hypothetical protein L6452_38369 [Arctium lappa]|uniref:Uncharacterized protein n=1 Tax=Arctium lappa TaxID=4217 RepID=A0ACB8Y695_ARCLA|nr:hypothetical protein L6452_38369 [Arctium lappa]